MTLLPTALEATNTFQWIGYLLAASVVLALFCVALALLLDWYEDRRQAKQAEREAETQALRRRASDEVASYRRLVLDAHKLRLRQRERDEERYYQKALQAASEPGPWPPVRLTDAMRGNFKRH